MYTLHCHGNSTCDHHRRIQPIMLGGPSLLFPVMGDAQTTDGGGGVVGRGQLAPFTSTESLRELCKLPQRGPGQSPGRQNVFFCILEAPDSLWVVKFAGMALARLKSAWRSRYVLGSLSHSTVKANPAMRLELREWPRSCHFPPGNAFKDSEPDCCDRPIAHFHFSFFLILIFLHLT